MAGTLYLVATPIGNLEDMTFRAVRILKEVDFIAAEDTRTSRPLLGRYGIDRPLVSCHLFNEDERGEEIVARLLKGESAALITDAGMPAVSDPGEKLVRLAQEAGITVTCVPGACAAVTALALSGLSTRSFAFEGFLPRDAAAKKEVLSRLAKEERTIILYEAPHRLKKTIGSLEAALGGEREITLCRELTKRYETILKMDLGSVKAALEGGEMEPRGEYVLVIAGRDKEAERQEKALLFSEMSVEEHVALYEAKGMPRKEAMKAAAADRGVTKREIYAALDREGTKGRGRRRGAALSAEAACLAAGSFFSIRIGCRWAATPRGVCRTRQKML